MRYLEFCAILNFFPSLFSIYGLLPYKISPYLELPYLESRTNILVPSKNDSRYLELFRKCSSEKPINESFFLCVQTRVFN